MGQDATDEVQWIAAPRWFEVAQDQSHVEVSLYGPPGLDVQITLPDTQCRVQNSNTDSTGRYTPQGRH